MRQPRWLPILVFVAFFFRTGAAPGSPPDQPPHPGTHEAILPAQAAVMTTEERLLRRYDSTRGDVTRVDGNRELHLFMKWELFDNLLRSTLSGDAAFNRINQRAVAHSAHRAKIKAKAGAQSFPQLLAAIAGPYVEARNAARHAGRPLSEAEGRGLCALRFQTMTQLRAEFEPGEFDRFLYHSVAPTSFAHWTDGAEQLRYIEEGCK